MIPRLYIAETQKGNFNNNGLGLLKDAVSFTAEEVRNGLYECTLLYPVGGRLWDCIKGQMYIKGKANDRYGPQIFRIYYISKPINGVFTVKGEHISYKTKYNFVRKCSYTGNCAGALEALNEAATYDSGFNFYSDITMTGKINLERQYLWDCIVGTKGSIVDTYGNGADIIRDNFDITVKQNGGVNKKVLIAYRKNMTGFTCEEDWSECYTKIYPYAVNPSTNEVIEITGYYVDSEYINRDPEHRVLPLDCSSSFSEGEEITEAKLIKKAQDYFKNNKCDIPKLSYKIEFVALKKTLQYKNKSMVEDIGMFDEVIIRHSLYGLNSTAKVCKTKYDGLNEMYEKIEVGDIKSSLNTEISNLVNDEVGKSEDIVKKSYMDEAIKTLSDAITGNDGGYVRLNPPENPSEILVMDNENINNAQVVWRWNKEGLGVSTTGYNGSFYGLAKNGKLVISEATAFKFSANLIEAGVIKSIDGKTIFDLGTGLITLYDNLNKNYSAELGNNALKLFDRWDSLGNQKNQIGSIESVQLKGSYFGYNIGNESNTRVGMGIIASYGDCIALVSEDGNGNYNPMFMMENSADGSNNINQGNRFGFLQDVAMLNGSQLKFYGTLHNFIGSIYFDSNSRMVHWGTGGHSFLVGQQERFKITNTGAEVIGTFTDSSDLAYKKNVKKLDKDTLQILKDIDIYEYEENGTIEIGLLAQEAVDVVPEIIKGEVTETTIQEANTMTDDERAEKLKGGKGASVDVYSMLSLLWDANKKLLDKITALENEVRILKNN